MWGDEARRLIEGHLGPPAQESPDGLEAVYFCPLSGQQWLSDHPNRSGQDPGPMRIRINQGQPSWWRRVRSEMAFFAAGPAFEGDIGLFIAADGKLSAGRFEEDGTIHTDVSVSPGRVRAMAEDVLSNPDNFRGMRMLREALEEKVVSELHTAGDD